MTVRQAAETIDRTIDPQVLQQYKENQRDLSSLRAGESKMIGDRLWARGEDGRLYYNSQGEKDQTFGCLSDPKWYVRDAQSGGTFTAARERLNGGSLNAAYFVSEDGKKVFDCKGTELAPNENGVYTLPNPVTETNEYVKQGDDGQLHRCSESGRIYSDHPFEELVRPRPNQPAPDAGRPQGDSPAPAAPESPWVLPAQQEIHRSTPADVKQQYEDNRDRISGLENGQSITIGQRKWTRGDDGRLYYNSQADKKQTFGCLSDPDWYVADSSGFTKVRERLNGMSLNAHYYVSEGGKVYDYKGTELKPNENGVYTLPNPATRRDEYIKRGDDGEFHSCSENGRLHSSNPWEELTGPRPAPAAEQPQGPAAPESESPWAMPRPRPEEPAPEAPARPQRERESIEPTTHPLVAAEYTAHQREIDSLKPGETFTAPAQENASGRIWMRGEDGKLYYNSQGLMDNTFGCLSDPDFHVGTGEQGGKFTRVSRAGTGTTPADGVYFVDGAGTVYNEMGVKLNPRENGIYRLPNPRTNEWVYIKPNGDGTFSRCDERGNAFDAQPQPDIRPRPDIRPEPIAGPARAEPDRASERLARRQFEVATNTLGGGGGERLVDSSRFLDAETREKLGQYTGSSDETTGLRFSGIQKDGYSFAFTRNGETWYVSQSPFYRDQYPQGQSFEKARCCIWKAGSDGQVQREFRARDVFSRDGSIDFGQMASYMREAEENARSQAENGRKIQQLDLRGQPVGYIGLASGGQDPVIDGLREDVRAFPRMMNGIATDGKPGYDFRVENGSDAVTVSRSPAGILDEQLSSMHRQGIRTFYLNFAGHGNDSGVHFTTDSGQSFVLSGEELTRLFDKYKDSRFIVDTVACHGAGFAQALAGYQDRYAEGDAPRVVVKLQSKPDSVNQEGRIAIDRDGIPEPFSSYYNIFNNYYLQRGCSIGEAHLLADEAAKRYSPCDAEAWISTGRGGSVIKGLQTAAPGAFMEKVGLNELTLPPVRRTQSGGTALG